MERIPFGYWPSPLSAPRCASARSSRAQLSSDGTYAYWVESRPDEGGRVALVRAPAGGPVEELTGPEESVRSRVHEYGGGAACLVGRDGAVAYVNANDQQVVHRAPDGSRRILSGAPPEGEDWRHGDLRATGDGRLLFAVRERIAGDGAHHEVVAMAVDRPGVVGVVASGRDFYAAPRPSPDGRWLAFVCWDHPDMPWDSSELWVGALSAAPGEGGQAVAVVEEAILVAGGDQFSVGQPLWGTDGGLRFVWDRLGWWQPWRWWPGDEGPRRSADRAAEFHGPDWVLGQSTMAHLGGGRLACRWRADGVDHLGVLNEEEGTLTELVQPCRSITAVTAHGAGLLWLGRPADAPADLWWLPADGAAPASVPKPSAAGGTCRPFLAPPPDGSGAPAAAGDVLPAASVSIGRPFSCAGAGGRAVHGLHFAPLLEGVEGPSGQLPPLVVLCHAGPTGSLEAGFDPVVQFFTSRGFAVAAVDYAGSVGYGREVRRSLFGGWGVLDSQDCIAAARHLAGEGAVDGSRMAIRGASAGGFTALNALAEGDCFRAAASWYGVTDLLALQASTHDFESCYNLRLVGPLPGSEEEYRRRSPRSRAGEMRGSVLLLQGADDPVVPVDQARSMAHDLEAHGQHCDLTVFEGEGHGFRRAETIAESLCLELDFYRRVLLG